MKNEGLCEMAGCEVELENIMGDYVLFGHSINRHIRCCEECYEEFTNLETYGRPDYAYQWLAKTQQELGK